MVGIKTATFVAPFHLINPIKSSKFRNAKCTCNLTPDSPLSLPPFPDRRLVKEIPLPTLRECIHFLNLTNGLEALPMLRSAGISPGYVRIQSTLCEQQELERVISDLDSSLLLHLALGHCCLIYDLGSRNKKRAAPRAVWYGLEFIRYTLSCAWDVPLPPNGIHRAFLRGHDAHAAFDGHIRGFSTSTKRKLKYYAQYLPPNGLKAIQLYGVYKSTEHDVDFPFYLDIAHRNLLPNLPNDNTVKQSPNSTDFSTKEFIIESKRNLSSKVEFSNLPPAAEKDLGTRDHSAARIASPNDYSALSKEDIAALLDGNTYEAVHHLFGMHLFLGGLSHGELTKWKARMKETA